MDYLSNWFSGSGSSGKDKDLDLPPRRRRAPNAEKPPVESDKNTQEIKAKSEEILSKTPTSRNIIYSQNASTGNSQNISEKSLVTPRNISNLKILTPSLAQLFDKSRNISEKSLETLKQKVYDKEFAYLRGPSFNDIVPQYKLNHLSKETIENATVLELLQEFNERTSQMAKIRGSNMKHHVYSECTLLLHELMTRIDSAQELSLEEQQSVFTTILELIETHATFNDVSKFYKIEDGKLFSLPIKFNTEAEGLLGCLKLFIEKYPNNLNGFAIQKKYVAFETHLFTQDIPENLNLDPDTRRCCEDLKGIMQACKNIELLLRIKDSENKNIFCKTHKLDEDAFIYLRDLDDEQKIAYEKEIAPVASAINQCKQIYSQIYNLSINKDIIPNHDQLVRIRQTLENKTNPENSLKLALDSLD